MSRILLFEFVSSGAAAVTAKQDGLKIIGVEASEKIAESDSKRVLQYKDIFVNVGNNLTLAPELLAAICSRETRGRNIIGDHGNGVGLMQIDKRYHAFANGPDGLIPEKNIAYGAKLFFDYWRAVSKNHPTWPAYQQLKGAIAAYNSGVKNIQTIERMDIGTTGGDYSSDTWARARYYSRYFV